MNNVPEMIHDIAAQLNDDECAVLLLVAQGLERGRGVYGALDAAKETRNMVKEALEEVRDTLVYIGVKLVQLEQ